MKYILSILAFLCLACSAFAQQYTYIKEAAPISSTTYEASRIFKATPGILFSISGYNSRASTQFIQIHNSATLPADTAVPVVTFPVAASTFFSYTFQTPLNLSAGITVCNSSTAPTKTIGSADIFFMGQIK